MFSDHHDDRGVANHTADPRIVEAAGSCTSLVTDYLLETLPGASTAFPMPTHDLDNPPANLSEADGSDESDATMHGPLPKELIELILRTSQFRPDFFACRLNSPLTCSAHTYSRY